MCLEMSPTSNLFFGYVPCFGIDIFGGGVTIVFAGLRVVSFAVSLPGPKTVIYCAGDASTSAVGASLP